MEITSRDKRALRALGNALKPVVFIGKEGLSPSVLAAVDEAHLTEELIKVRILDTCAEDRKTVARRLDEISGSRMVQLLGRTVLLYRRNPENPRIRLPSLGSAGRA